MKILDQKPAEKISIKIGKTKIVYLNHHECHAA